MIRRFLTRILIVVLIAACVYNWQQTRALQNQVAALQARPRLVTVVSRSDPPPAALPGRWHQYKQQFLHRAAMRLTMKKVFSYVKL